MKRLRIYIAGPISKGDLAHNVNQATEAFIALAKAGLAPLCPQWSVYAKPAIREPVGWSAGAESKVWCEATSEGGSGMTHTDWLDVDLAWVAVADAVLRLPGESKGGDAEVWFARSRLIPAFGTVKEVLEWAEAQGE